MSERAEPIATALENVDVVAEVIESDVAALRRASLRSGWFRIEYVLAAILLALLFAYLLAYFVLDMDLDALRRWGYVGIFFIAMAGSATIVLPTPSTVAIFSGGVLLDPVLGIPAPLLVGVVAGLGDALGEFSGYALGYAGTDTVKNHRVYRTFEGWMKRNGRLTVFLLSTFPNPLFDIAGAAAGATRMPARAFFLATLAGKIAKDLFLAYGGSFSVAIIGDHL
jgi:uncharacterized membrane protein YdjX (TVP38/TMEM64 family)